MQVCGAIGRTFAVYLSRVNAVEQVVHVVNEVDTVVAHVVYDLSDVVECNDMSFKRLGFLGKFLALSSGTDDHLVEYLHVFSVDADIIQRVDGLCDVREHLGFVPFRVYLFVVESPETWLEVSEQLHRRSQVVSLSFASCLHRRLHFSAEVVDGHLEISQRVGKCSANNVEGIVLCENGDTHVVAFVSEPRLHLSVECQPVFGQLFRREGFQSECHVLVVFPPTSDEHEVVEQFSS